jgi:putative acetyltransferase
MEIRAGGLGDPQVMALIRHHLAEARGSTPLRNAHALDASGLDAPDIAFFSAWEGEALLGIGALRSLDAWHGEIKSMRTAPGHLRKGVARALLDHIAAEARARGFTRLSLETGTAPMFGPANAMYERYGFADCASFGGYPASEYNRFMTMRL